MSNSSKNTKSNKSQNLGCFGWLIIFILFLRQCSFIQTLNLTNEQRLSLEKEVQQVRSYFQEERCEEFYNYLHGSTSISKSKVITFCIQKSKQYERVKTINFVNSHCKSTTKLAGITINSTQCHLQYRLDLKNGESILETFSWQFEKNQYTLIHIS